ncbi:MAG: hypothetical protein ACRD3C_04815 [Vicinamibacterales bacterium]
MDPCAHRDLTVPNGDRAADPTTDATLEDLRELLTALDRRAPRVADTGEIDIARDAAALRARALERIAELTKSAS